MGCRWCPHAGGGAVVRRVGRNDAAGRRSIRLPSRSIFATLGILVRMDFVPGYSNRNDRGFVSRILPLSGRAVAANLGDQLHHPAHSYSADLCALAFHRSTGRAPGHNFPDLGQHEGAQVREGSTERLYHDENRIAAGSDQRSAYSLAGGRPWSRQTLVRHGLPRDSPSLVTGSLRPQRSECWWRYAALKLELCMRRTPGTTSPSPPARSGTRLETFHSRLLLEPSSSSGSIALRISRTSSCCRSAKSSMPFGSRGGHDAASHLSLRRPNAHRGCHHGGGVRLHECLDIVGSSRILRDVT